MHKVCKLGHICIIFFYCLGWLTWKTLIWSVYTAACVPIKVIFSNDLVSPKCSVFSYMHKLCKLGEICIIFFYCSVVDIKNWFGVYTLHHVFSSKSYFPMIWCCQNAACLYTAMDPGSSADTNTNLVQNNWANQNTEYMPTFGNSASSH